MNDQVISCGENFRLTGILSTPDIINYEIPVVIFLNAGLIHRIGPNQLYVKAARELALTGFSSLRLDLSGIGDSLHSNSKMIFEDAALLDIDEAIDYLLKTTRFQRFILFGICTGADFAFKKALNDSRIVGIIPINGVLISKAQLKEIYPIAERQIQIRYYKKKMLNYRNWLKLFWGQSKILKKINLKSIYKIIESLLLLLLHFFRNRKEEKKERTNETKTNKYSVESWEQLAQRDVKTLLVYSEGSNSLDFYRIMIADRIKNFINIEILIIKDVDHVFTPVWAQKHLKNVVTHWLKKSFIT